MAVSEHVRREIHELAEENRLCYQCGQCTSACPSGFDLDGGPRQVIRLILAEQVDELLASEDIWRCSACGSCSEACPMELDVAGALARLRALERAHGGQRCPEREAATVATRHLSRRDRIENVSFGAAMVARGFVPKDVIGAAGTGASLLRQKLRRGPAAPLGAAPGTGVRGTDGTSGTTDRTTGTGEAAVATARRPFYVGCALPQDPEALAQTRAVATDLGLPLVEAAGAPCCGHPSRGATATGFTSDDTVLTVCPACDASLEEAGTHTVPLWEALVEHALRGGRDLTAAAPSFVPYVGCLGEHDRALDALAGAAALAHVDCLTSFPSLHAGCCGALGGMYRGETAATRRLLDYAAERFAPVVTTCLLCRDNLRSAARRRRLPIKVHYWPEFFSAGPADPPTGDAHD